MLIPNNVQKTKMFQYAGASRFAYNWALAREKESYEKGDKFISDSELRKEFTKLRHSDEYAWLLNISNNVTKQAIKDACTAYVSLCAGSFTAGFVAAKRRRCKGLLIGLACGIAMYLVTFLIGLLLLQSFAAAGTFSKLIFMVLCSCIGGVVGVNTKCRVPRC